MYICKPTFGHTMKDRLQQILSAKSLSANRLADILEIQPSGISHILAGRNKPSIDFVCKLLKAFPDLNPDWFILGTGSMYRNSSDNPPEQAQTDDASTSASASASEPKMDVATVMPACKSVQRELSFSAADTGKTMRNEQSHSRATTEPENMLPADPTVGCRLERKIRKVMIFYADHTVESFNYTEDE